MITDEQITDIFKKHGCYIDEDMSAMRAVREIIALAQQVKPLEFIYVSQSDRTNSKCYKAKACLGTYEVYDVEGPNGRYYFYADDCELSEKYSTLDEAIEAANADYRKRVLSCLVHGGV